MRRVLPLVLLVACGNDSTGEPGSDAGMDTDDPLAITDEPEPGSLDDLHERIIAKRCSGQPGLCHNGQFEPNLSTPALTYAYVVNRPGIEKADRLRVKPGDPGTSLFIDKIRNRNVTTRMPLGAEPLSDEDTAALERWITDGALRSPGAAPAPVLNNPPRRPQIGVFTTSGTRLDGGGTVNLSVGQTVVFRHTVQDFETLDSAIPFSAITLPLGDGVAVTLDPGNADDMNLGPTTFDSTSPPMGIGDAMNREFTWTVPAMLPRFNTVTKTAMPSISASGVNLGLQAFYIDSIDVSNPQMPKFGMLAFEAAMFTVHIQ